MVHLLVFLILATSLPAKTSIHLTKMNELNNARFEHVLKTIFRHEGRFSNEKHDKGGATHYGISLRYLRLKELDLNKDGSIDERDIFIVDKDVAAIIYKRDWWDRYNYSNIENLALATKLFDLAIWMGATQAHKLLQISLNRLGENLITDGILGSKTLKAVSDFQCAGNTGKLINELRDNAVHFIINLIADNPDLSKFKQGWLLRAGE